FRILSGPSGLVAPFAVHSEASPLSKVAVQTTLAPAGNETDIKITEHAVAHGQRFDVVIEGFQRYQQMNRRWGAPPACHGCRKRSYPIFTTALAAALGLEHHGCGT